ncbi:endonuclease domain-containing protein [Paraburkholderia sp.]|uniref:endonuclease domain-containing protein n=1 Tax=Paraburkholderia sp. TaxID=1926495 RepID=UPI003C736550
MTAEDKAEWITEYWRHHGRSCQICRRKALRNDMVSDHCHESGMTRAALCGSCNTLLGFVETSRYTDGEMLTLLMLQRTREGYASKTAKLRGDKARSLIRRMRTYIEFWRLHREAFALYVADPSDFAGLARANTVAALRYKRWLRKTHDLRAYHVACWIDDKRHTHTLARRYRELLAEGWPVSVGQ